MRGGGTAVTERKARKCVDSVPMVNARKARPMETTEKLQKCVSFWQRRSRSFISSHYNRLITQTLSRVIIPVVGGCFSCKQMLVLLSILSPQLSLWQVKSIKASFRERKFKRSEKNSCRSSKGSGISGSSHISYKL